MRVKHIKFLTIVISLLMLLNGCELMYPEGNIPAYIHIDSISLIDNPLLEEGSLSARIVDAWVYVDDNLVGAFELPCTFPILLEDTQNIQVHAGIYLNGVKTTRVYYPMFKSWESKLKLVPDSVVNITPHATYDDKIKMQLHETFELGGVIFEDDLKSKTSLFKTTDPTEVFEGNNSGKVVLNDSESIWMCVSIEALQLPTAGGHVFLEMNYKSEADIVVGIYAIKASQILKLEVAGAMPKDEWSKIYFNLTPAVFRHNDALEFKVFIGSYLPQGKTEATVLLDNIKLIHF